jgi:hypothetical protein
MNEAQAMRPIDRLNRVPTRHGPRLQRREFLIQAWREQGRTLAKADSARQFDIGDWLLTGEVTLGRKLYDEARTIFRGYTRGSLKQFAYVARQCPASIRIYDTLGFAHYQLVAPYPVEEQHRLLGFAQHVNGMAGCNMAVECFRTHIREHHPSAKKERKLSTTIRITLPPEIFADVELIARSSGKPIETAVLFLVKHALGSPEVTQYVAQELQRVEELVSRSEKARRHAQ